MTELFAISQSKSIPPGEDYQSLFEEGLALAKRLSRKHWTDFNEHDPGLTILEVLSYLITELSYKANLPVENLLADSQGRIDYKRAGFFKPKDILPSAPVTIPDFVKIILDQFPNVLNAAIQPVNKKGQMDGNYQVLVAVDPMTENNPAHDDEQYKLADDIKTFLNANRNLCEFFESVTFYVAKPLVLHLAIETGKHVDPNKLLAGIYKGINDYLFNPARFHSASEMISLGYDIEEIYSGPLLENGFLPDKITAPPNAIDTNDFVRIIFEIDGVLEVKELKTEGSSIWISNPGEVFYIDVRASFETALITSGKIKQACDLNAVIMEYNLLSKKKGLKNKDNNIEGKSDLKKIAGIHEYSSIQNDFPQVYGIGEHGLPVIHDKSTRKIRKARANQLKAYLLHFEQLAANFMMQVERTRDVFSNSPLTETYYSQTLSSIKGISDLLDSGDENISRFFLNYKDYLKKLDSNFDNIEYRRNRMLNHLLARYSYDLDYDLEESSGYKISRKQMLMIKSGFVSKLPVISNRKFSANVRDGFFSGSTVELALRLILGLKTGTTLSTKRVKELFYKLYEENKPEGLYLNEEISTDEMEFIYETAGRPSNYGISSVENEFQAVLVRDSKEILRISDDKSAEIVKRKVNELANWVDKLFLKFDSFYVVENILFSGLELPGQVVPLTESRVDFYKMEITFLFPAFTGKFSSAEFKVYVEKEIMNLCPAHINFSILYLSLADYMEAERLMPTWKSHFYEGKIQPDIKNTGALLQNIILKNTAVTKLFKLK